MEDLSNSLGYVDTVSYVTGRDMGRSWLKEEGETKTMEREAFIKDLKDNRSEYFKKRFGAEIEFESNEFYDKNYLSRLFIGNGVDIDKVIGDGSLSDNGFEVLIKPQDSLDNLLTQMDNIRGVLDGAYVSYKSGSPCAIHVHMSNYEKPTHLFVLFGILFNILKHMTRSVHNELVNRSLMIPNKDSLKLHISQCPKNFEDFDPTELSMFKDRGFDPIYTREIWDTHSLFMGSRRCTLRFSG
ncbi:MAG: hypothetical protein K8E24_012890, partial [Methanobacterium paludis]|nr:hypothetical protein [Methanobacterium paludis]